MIVLDASVLIALLTKHDAHHDAALDLFENNNGPWTVHPLTMAEVLVGPARLGLAAQALRDLTDIGVYVDSSAIDPMALASVRVEHGLKMPDACVLALAEALDAALVTFDAKLADRAGSVGRLHA